MRKLINAFFQNVRFKKKLIIVFMFVCILPMILLAGWLSMNFYNQLLQNSLKDSNNAGSTIATMISERIAVMNDTLSTVASDKRTTDILKHMGKLSNYPLNAQIRDKDNFLSLIFTLSKTSRLYGIRLYMPNEYYFAHNNSNIFPMSMAPDASWYQQYMNSPGRPALLYNSTTMEYPTNSVTVSRDTRVISLVKPMYNPNNLQQVIALAVAEIPHTEIKSMTREVKNQFSVYVLENGTATFVEGEDILKDTNIDLEGYDAGWRNINIRRKGVFYISQIGITGTDIKLVIVVPTANIMRVIQNQLLVIIGIILVLSVAVSLLAIYFATGISKRLEILLKKVNRIRHGDFDIGKVETSRDEIGILGENLSFMAESIENLMKEQNRLGQEMKATEARIAKAELLALQSQINPHFLYNTLDLISWQSRFNNMPEMGMLIKALSKFYKASLSKESELVGLASELQHVESFITIQNYRYKNAISFEAVVPSHIRCKLPKITLQPLVENAIIHGILCKPEVKGKITIRAENLIDSVQITISDDGVGMSEKKVRELNAQIDKNDNGIGILNVYERLKIYFGDNISLYFSSVKDQGTEVILIVPEAN